MSACIKQYSGDEREADRDITMATSIPQHTEASQTLNRDLVEWARCGDTARVEAAVRDGADLTILLPSHDPEAPGATLLTLAAGKGHAQIVALLLKAGVPVDAKGHFPYTPLQVAVHRGLEQVVKILLPQQPNLNIGDKHGVTALHLAARRGWDACARALVEVGADIDARDSTQRTPLHHSIIGNSPGVMRLLLDAGCDISALSNTSSTAMHFAALAGNERAIQELSAAGLSTSEKDGRGLTPEEVAEAWGKHNTAWLLRKMPKTKPASKLIPTNTLMRRSLEEYESEGEKTLHWVKEENDAFLEANVPENRDGHYQDHNGWTPLHWAAHLGLTTIARTLLESCGAMARVLTYTRDTPADLARKAGHHNLAEWLNASPESQEGQGKKSATTLYYRLLTVISAGDDVVEACRILGQGAPVLPIRDFYTSALILAVTCNRPRIISALVACGAPLTTSVGGLSLLQVAWTSPDVTIRVKAQVTRYFLHVLEAERLRVKPQDSNLISGISHLLERLKGGSPKLTFWPSQPQSVLTSLLVSAAINDCPLTASFLRQAGAKAYLLDHTGRTVVHAALETGHWEMFEVALRDLGGCLYIPDARGMIPLALLRDQRRKEAEENTYHREKRQMEDIVQKCKDADEKQKIQQVIDLYSHLFSIYSSHSNEATAFMLNPASLPYALLLASRQGLLHLTYLLVRVGGLTPDTVVDPTQDSCALHQAASHGNSGCVALLLALGARPLQQDRYGHTPAHLAAMFGHQSTYEQLVALNPGQDLGSRAGTTPEEINDNFQAYLQCYRKRAVDPEEKSLLDNPSKLIKNVLYDVDLKHFLSSLHQITVDFSQKEAQEVKRVMLVEVQGIVDKVSEVNELYRGNLIIVGSSEDGTRLYAPDEYDMNLVLTDIDVNVEVSEQEATQIALSGHRLEVKVMSDNPSLQENTLVSEFFELVKSCLKTHSITDPRLSLVPPGVARTQAGVALAFAWQGREYPLLLIGVDLVPVLRVQWPSEVHRPSLTPTGLKHVYLSNVGEGTWRFSFAGAEAEVLARLDKHERRVYIALKALLSTLKSEPWMPREVKSNYMWWDSRSWKLMVPAGFAMKNVFLRQMQRKHEEQLVWAERDMKEIIIAFLRDMCQDFRDPSTGVESLVPAKISAYFGGDFEVPKIGEGAPEIIKILQEEWHP